MKLSSILESILFSHGEPLALTKLVKLTKKTKEEVEDALTELKKEYQNRGLLLMEHDTTWQMGTNPKNAPYLEELLKSDLQEELSRAALETLSIVAYKGPLTRAEIEYIRGVNSSFTLRNLLMRGLVERTENLKDARAPQYQVSFDFLKHFGFSSINELPGYGELMQKDIPLPQSKEEIHDK